MDAEQTLDDMADSLKTAGHRVVLLGETLPDPPCVVLIPPGLRWTTLDVRPDEGTFGAAFVVAHGDTSSRELVRAIYAITEALDTASGEYVIKEARPDSFPSANGSLPAYIIEIEAGLT